MNRRIYPWHEGPNVRSFFSPFSARRTAMPQTRVRPSEQPTRQATPWRPQGGWRRRPRATCKATSSVLMAFSVVLSPHPAFAVRPLHLASPLAAASTPARCSLEWVVHPSSICGLLFPFSAFADWCASSRPWGLRRSWRWRGGAAAWGWRRAEAVGRRGAARCGGVGTATGCGAAAVRCVSDETEARWRGDEQREMIRMGKTVQS